MWVNIKVFFSFKKYLGTSLGPVVKNPPSNAGDTGSIPGRGTKIPHATGQLSPCAATTELVHLNKRARLLKTKGPMCSGAHVPWSLSATTREKPMRHKRARAAMKDLVCLNEDPACPN